MRRVSGLLVVLALGLALPALGGEAASKSEKKEISPLLNPTGEEMNRTAPDLFRAKFETTKGDFVVEVTRAWSPNGADRFYNLVRNGFYDDCRFFRVLDFMAQFGINGDPKVTGAWRGTRLMDDPVKQSNTRGFVTYAKTNAPNSRSTQIFINYKNNSFLDGQGFSPFGKVIEGMEVVDQLYKGYGEGAPRGRGPSQRLIETQGTEYLVAKFPKLDYIKKATLIE